MKNCIVSHLAFACAIGASIAAAITPNIGRDVGGVVATRQETECSKTAVDSCVAATGNDGTACFEQICVGTQSRKAKRDDQCSEDNLFQCAATQDPSDCFQEFCL
ncbi:hypothetical protein F4809DRAFT_622948 [Biscogniauxia mediterranea]|nr:hypothetical protein F4809DRAFT_622948 [Biscogniauxia mediterranea]